MTLCLSQLLIHQENPLTPDFVPAAKLARREGIDFILDPMFANVESQLFEHIEGRASLPSILRGKRLKRNPNKSYKAADNDAT